MRAGVCVIFTGTTAPVACPEGSWSNNSGLRFQEDCKPCPGGFYCDSVGLTEPSGPCKPGYTTLWWTAHCMTIICASEFGSCFLYRYYCVEGAVTFTPTDGITGGPCPEGSYCPEGTVQPVPCDPGTYVTVTHATQCEPCVPGWYCVSGSLYLCPAGLWFVICMPLYIIFFHLYANFMKLAIK